ncbi:hypothetical protein BASA60_001598 [Batrachochytrium salamandrivorans]|nr:hypothetical protein BASA60_001598 [Batrachochytrium salamandrivorans]
MKLGIAASTERWLGATTRGTKNEANAFSLWLKHACNVKGPSPMIGLLISGRIIRIPATRSYNWTSYEVWAPETFWSLADDDAGK